MREDVYAKDDELSRLKSEGKGKGEAEHYSGQRLVLCKLPGSIWPSPYRKCKCHVFAVDHFHRNLIATLNF